MSVYVLFVNTESLVSFLFRNAACVTRFLLRLSARTFSNWMLPQRNGMQQPCEMRGGNPRKVRRMSTRSLPLTGSHFHSLCKLRFAHLQKWKWNFFGEPLCLMSLSLPHLSLLIHLLPLIGFLFWYNTTKNKYQSKSYGDTAYPLERVFLDYLINKTKFYSSFFRSM